MREIGEKILDIYRIESILGKNDLSTTYLVADIRSGVRFVIRETPLAAISHWDDLGDHAVQTMKSISHPNVPGIVDALTDEQAAAYLLVSEYIEGENLKQRLDNGESFNSEKVESIVVQILNALEYLHGLQPPVIHGNITPKNIVLDSEGTAVLVSLGSAKSAGERSRSESDDKLEDSGYMPLEQRRGAAIPESDLYSLGMTAVHLLTGKHPYLLPTKRFKPVFSGTAPSTLLSIIDRMIEPDARNRIAGASRALAALGKAGQQPLGSGYGARESFDADKQHKAREMSGTETSDASNARGRAAEDSGVPVGNLSGVNLTIHSDGETNRLVAENNASRKPEYQLAGIVLDLWISKPWLIMLIALVVSGGPAVIPFLILYGYGKTRSWINRAYSKIRDIRISVTPRTFSVSDQVKKIPRDDIVDMRLDTQKQTDGRLQVGVSLRMEKVKDIDFYISNLSKEDADAALDFLEKNLRSGGKDIS